MKIIESKNTHNIYKVLKEVIDVSDKEIISNSTDASKEKHLPQYEIHEGKVEIKVPHVMEEDHYIEWIMVEYENVDITKYLKPKEEAKMIVDYVKGMKIYAYCNQHGLWSVEI